MRVASLLPSATEMVCAVGARDDLVGRSHECDHGSVSPANQGAGGNPWNPWDERWTSYSSAQAGELVKLDVHNCFPGDKAEEELNRHYSWMLHDGRAAPAAADGQCQCFGQSQEIKVSDEREEEVHVPHFRWIPPRTESYWDGS